MIQFSLLLAAASYVLWGILYHWHRGDLHPKVVLEYVGIAAIGVAAALSVIRYL